MKSILALALCLASFGVAATAEASGAAGLTPTEERRKTQLQERLCAVKELNCTYVIALFTDPRLEIYYPPEPERQKATPLHSFRRTRSLSMPLTG
jgi:hypothetical protein